MIGEAVMFSLIFQRVCEIGATCLILYLVAQAITSLWGQVLAALPF
jgi:hypothetical protein